MRHLDLAAEDIRFETPYAVVHKELHVLHADRSAGAKLPQVQTKDPEGQDIRRDNLAPRQFP